MCCGCLSVPGVLGMLGGTAGPGAALGPVVAKEMQVVLPSWRCLDLPQQTCAHCCPHLPASLPRAQVEGGDHIQILTPGGGGYGPPPGAEEGDAGGDGEAVALAAVVSGMARRRRAASGEFSAPLRDGGSVQQYTRAQETV